MGNALQPVQQGSSTQQHASRHSSEQDTVLWAVLDLHHLSFRFPSASGVAHWMLLESPGLHKVWSFLKVSLHVSICCSTVV